MFSFVRYHVDRLVWEMFIFPYRALKYADITPEIGQTVQIGKATGTITDIKMRVIQVQGVYNNEPWLLRFHKIYFTEARWSLANLCWLMDDVKDM